ncbi:MAG: hypothetical protein AAFX65_00260 [Cyanobacteria bacterium J06638_7]
MEIPGLKIKSQNGNEIWVDEKTRFENSRITVTGKNCSVNIGRARFYRGLLIHLDGDDKHVKVGDTNEHIINLRILSQRGRGQAAEIGSGLRCNGIEIQMTDGDSGVVIGNDCLISWGVKVRTSDGHAIIDIESGKAVNFSQDVRIGNRVWICEDVKILKGVELPADTIIASGSTITKSFPSSDSCSVIGGCPGRVLKRGVRWDMRSPSEI